MQNGKKIRDLRRQRRWTQAELAAEASVSTATVSNGENESRRLQMETILRIAKALNVTPSEIQKPLRTQQGATPRPPVPSPGPLTIRERQFMSWLEGHLVRRRFGVVECVVCGGGLTGKDIALGIHPDCNSLVDRYNKANGLRMLELAIQAFI